MKHLYRPKINNLFTTLALLFVLTLSSCGEDSPDVPANEDDIKSTVLLYAVASNNLYSNLLEDKEEIIAAARNMDLTHLRMLVYQVTPYDEPVLLELKKSIDGEPAFKTVKQYSKDLYSTDPRRISEVINDVRAGYDSDLYGLVLWSHGTGLDPFASSRSSGDAFIPMLYSFGSDKDSDKDSSYYDQINIDELADAIPDNLFSFIWFDACYMCGIETIYELRNKCEYFVGYPTEVCSEGMPYNLTLPYFLADKPDLRGGAEKFFDYYNNYAQYKVATICVLDMNKLEPVADFCKEAYAGTSLTSNSGLQKYTRGSIGPFYDFGQYTNLMARKQMSPPDFNSFEAAFNDMVIFSAATENDFNYRPINKENFSGISCHLFFDDGSRKSEFYKTLDWYRRVYE